MNTDSGNTDPILLAYSGGLDTSVILKWLEDTYGCEVVTFTADIGQGEEVEPARAKAEALGVKEIYIDDLREEFVGDFVYPMFRANTVYEGEYLLGTSIARPLIAKRLIDIANETGADAISHGATGKGNDQVRFELGAYALKPGIKVIAPWREWDLGSRESLMAYCETHNIPVDFASSKKKSPYSMDANLLHISYEGGILEDPWAEPEESMWRWTVAPEAAPDGPTYLELRQAVATVVTRAEKQDRRIVSWSEHDLDIVRSLANEPALILADEPTGNLDSERSHEIMELLLRLNNDEGITVILVTHEDEMAQYARRCVRFLDGRIQSDDAAGAKNECSGIC